MLWLELSIKNRVTVQNSLFRRVVSCASKRFWSHLSDMNLSHPKLQRTRFYKQTQLLALYQNHYATFISGFQKTALKNTDRVVSEKIADTDHLKVDVAYSTRPKKQRSRYLCGEDALYVGTNREDNAIMLSVFDGVGGYASLNVDPAEFSNLMADSCRLAFEEDSSTDLKNVLQRAYSRATSWQVIGGTTAVLARYLPSESIVEVLNLGDSKALHFSKNESGDYIVRDKTDEQEHFFNCPYQLSYSNADSYSDAPETAVASTFSVKNGDVIVLATDGLTDNLREDQILQIINEAQRTNKEDDFARVCSETLTREALAVAKNSTSKDTPFALRAGQAFYSYRGGKMDDITNIVCHIR